MTTAVNEGVTVYTLKNMCGFSLEGRRWDVQVEHGSSELDQFGHATGADVDELWRWLSAQLGQRHLDIGGGQMLTTVYEPGEQEDGLLVRELYERPSYYTAERLAAHFLLEFRKLSSKVQAVTVWTDIHTHEQRSCTVRTNETRGVSQEELVAAFRSYAQINGHRLTR